MRLWKLPLLGLVLTGVIGWTGCADDTCVRTEEYVEWQPVYKRIDEMRVPIAFGQARPMENPGKIFYYKGYLLVNELQAGIHIIDNRNPASPLKVGFLEVPGNIDMAVHGDILYVDSYLDLVGIDIHEPLAPVEVSRVEDVFQTFYSYSETQGYLVEYLPTDIRRTIDCRDSNFGLGIWREGEILLASDNSSGIQVGSGAPINSSVIGGSMARFTTAADHLYTIDGQEIKVFDVRQAEPVLRNEVVVQWGIETLFPMAGSLFVGANSGMYIFDISDPAAPMYRSSFGHATACDPVFVSGDVAYVTLRDGSACQGFVNQLDVIDVSSLDNPRLIRSYPMTHPHGLSVVGNTLYLCEGRDGLKIFDVADPDHIDERLLDHVSGFNAYDVIVLPPGDLVMVIGQDGLYQFDAADPNHLRQISLIAKGQ